MPLTRIKNTAIGDGGISTAKLADGAVTTVKVADDAVNSAKIGVDVIAAEDLAANSVTVSEISDGAVTGPKLADNLNYDSGTLYLDSTNNRVAIGSTSSLEKLRVAGNIEVYNDDADGYIWFHDAGTRSWAVGSVQSTGKLSINYNQDFSSAERFTIDPNGFTSLNTTTGNERLNVAGAIGSSGASANFGAGDERIIMDFTGSVARVGHVNGASGSAKPLHLQTAGVTRVAIDGNNVGIGTTSPSLPLHIENTNNARALIKTTNSGSVAALQLQNTATTAEIGVETSTDAGGGAYAGYQTGATGASGLHILNNNNVGIVVDTSGRVSHPNQVAFAAYLNTSFTNVVNVATRVTGWTLYGASNYFGVQTRRHHSSFASDQFTAPVAGLYLMVFKPDFSGTQTTGWYCSWGVNGHTRTLDVVEDLPHYANSTQAYMNVLELDQGDYVRIYGHGGSAWAMNSGGNQWNTWWMGYKIA